MIYLDNAATTFPKPECVYEAMDKFLREKGANPGRAGHRMSVEAEQEIEKTRVVVSKLLGINNTERMIFTFSATDALNMGIKGLLSEGDHVITSKLEHNSISRPLGGLENKGIITVTRVENSDDGFIDADDIEKAIRSNTKLIICTHASNVLGTIQPIREIGEIARERDLLFMVDAAQTMGVCRIDVEDYNIDMLAFTGHKGPYGPPGSGGLYVGERVDLRAWREGGTGFEPESLSQPDTFPYKLESGTPNSVGIIGLKTGLEFCIKEGIDKIGQHERKLVLRMIRALETDHRFEIYGCLDGDRKVGIVSINIKGLKPSEVGAILDNTFNIAVRSGMHCAPHTHRRVGTFPEGMVRISPGYFNTMEEIDETISGLKKIADSSK
ncbi:MAG: aminotransferase class V-fold PLP-dependent enzyme [Candidatus Scalindua sp.]|mgnify:FL=1|jgi:cysteine desulfurase family protein|nr:aminotransferase class V-fold PLP-dependent enzyme [Candidatus Scalindua sp.]MBT6226590.1 aminotransferase class V-fold PLP-dependent enzyme [Candidatus Scalindua sp.]MBT6562229.1 aminotransferase class V-fold PLP-dependent enzyme [Candidatus Scalindua sp.]MBT7211662.1 aminotransferase class V-fold PLP-dependent enzyme [Candidatus Scalindua sp.]MBT7591765.1 aminotransferase class V-fold PLP-dependent enzyme [Candidatus Scalindua sp.]